MKKRNILFLILLALFSLLSCKNNSQESKSDNSLPASTSQTASSADAHFSCRLNGKEFSASGTDQNINAAFRLTGDNKGKIFFKLADLNDATQKLNFELASTLGSTTISTTPTFSYVGFVTKIYINYLDNPLTVTIKSVSPTRISGTFSGTYILSEGSAASSAKQTIEVTDGTFDIPFSTSDSWKKLYNAE